MNPSYDNNFGSLNTGGPEQSGNFPEQPAPQQTLQSISSSQDDIILAPSKPKKSKKWMIITLLVVVLSIIGAIIVILITTSKSDSFAQNWDHYYNLLVYGINNGDVSNEQLSRKDISSWYVYNLDKNIKTNNELMKYFTPLSSSYYKYYKQAPDNLSINKEEYNNNYEIFLNYNLLYEHTEKIKSIYIDNGTEAATDYINSIFTFDASSFAIGNQINEYLNNSLNLIVLYNQNGCYDAPNFAVCISGIETKEKYDLLSRVDSIRENLTRLYSPFINNFLQQTTVVNNAIGGSNDD